MFKLTSWHKKSFLQGSTLQFDCIIVSLPPVRIYFHFAFPLSVSNERRGNCPSVPGSDQPTVSPQPCIHHSDQSEMSQQSSIHTADQSEVSPLSSTFTSDESEVSPVLSLRAGDQSCWCWEISSIPFLIHSSRRLIPLFPLPGLVKHGKGCYASLAGTTSEKVAEPPFLSLVGQQLWGLQCLPRWYFEWGRCIIASLDGVASARIAGPPSLGFRVRRLQRQLIW